MVKPEPGQSDTEDFSRIYSRLNDELNFNERSIIVDIYERQDSENLCLNVKRPELSGYNIDKYLAVCDIFEEEGLMTHFRQGEQPTYDINSRLEHFIEEMYQLAGTHIYENSSRRIHGD